MDQIGNQCIEEIILYSVMFGQLSEENDSIYHSVRALSIKQIEME
jgi:hypothetical protein